MGLFDFFRRKPEKPAENEVDLAEPRHAHYMLAHYGLRLAAFENPVFFLGAMSASPDTFLADLLDDVQTQGGDREPQLPFGLESIKVHILDVGKYPCVVVEMPSPRAASEAHFVAAVVLLDSNAPPSEAENVGLRYFTLEKAMPLGEPPSTMLCEWTKSGTHSNFGRGPEPHLTLFLAAVEESLKQRP